MPLVFPSVFSVSRFDGRKLLVIMTIVAVTLTVESQVSTVADFIPEQLASNTGIVAFIGIWAVCSVMQYYILVFIKHNNKKSSPRTKFVHSIHSIVTIVQFLLTGISNHCRHNNHRILIRNFLCNRIVNTVKMIR